MEIINFKYENLTCCSVDLSWNINSSSNMKSNYKLYQKEKEKSFRFNIYEGQNTKFNVHNLKANTTYTFELIAKNEKQNCKKTVEITTKNSPPCIISKNSLNIANGGPSTNSDEIKDFVKDMIYNCGKFIYEQNDECFIKANFDGIIIKVAHNKYKDKDIYYISFDIDKEFIGIFIYNYFENCKKNVNLPYYFIFKKLPTYFIFDLIEKGAVILTGKRFGGNIASSFALSILKYGQNFGNAFIEQEKKHIGVITFGSSSFIYDGYFALQSLEFIDYFYNIKEEYDFIPQIIDFMDKYDNKQILKQIVLEDNVNNENINILNEYIKTTFNENNIKYHIDNFKKIPFGNFLNIQKKNEDLSLIKIDESRFYHFFYKKIEQCSYKFPTKNFIYQNIRSNNSFSKKDLEYFLNENTLEENVKVIRREGEEIEKKKYSGVNEFFNKIGDFNFLKTDVIKKVKGIVKIKLNDKITSDCIEKITMNNNKINKMKDCIFYENKDEVKVFVDDLNENIVDINITNCFGGKINVKKIINIHGSSKTRKMLKDNIEKLFLMPFFKLIEIIYISKFSDKEQNKRYIDLKKLNFGENFENIKILKPFENQIKIIDKLLYLTRPDLLAEKESLFFKEYLEKKDDDILLDKKICEYYEVAKIAADEIKCKINVVEKNSLASSIFKNNNTGIKKNNKKLFMTKNIKFESDDFLSANLNDKYIKKFLLSETIVEILKEIEKILKKQKNYLNDEKFEIYLIDNIGKIYNYFIEANIEFIRLIILITLEGGDYIKFKEFKMTIWEFLLMNMKCECDEPKIKKIIYSRPLEEEIEIEIFNLIKKKNTEKIMTTGIDIDKDFSKYSENSIYGIEYYESFLKLLTNNYSDKPEDIEVLIYNNLKKENNERKYILKGIKDNINEFLNDEESKKGFIALLHQSFYIGNLRNDIVRIYLFI